MEGSIQSDNLCPCENGFKSNIRWIAGHICPSLQALDNVVVLDLKIVDANIRPTSCGVTNRTQRASDREALYASYGM